MKYLILVLTIIANFAVAKDSELESKFHRLQNANSSINESYLFAKHKIEKGKLHL